MPPAAPTQALRGGESSSPTAARLRAAAGWRCFRERRQAPPALSRPLAAGRRLPARLPRASRTGAAAEPPQLSRRSGPGGRAALGAVPAPVRSAAVALRCCYSLRCQNHPMVEFDRHFCGSAAPNPFFRRDSLGAIVQIAFEDLQGLHSTSGHSIQAVAHPRSEKVFLDTPSEHSVSQFVPTVCAPATGHRWEEPGSLHPLHTPLSSH